MLLRLARGEQSLSDLARALEASWSAAKRLEDPTHWPSLKTLDRADAALGKRLVLVLEKTAPELEPDDLALVVCPRRWTTSSCSAS